MRSRKDKGNELVSHTYKDLWSFCPPAGRRSLEVGCRKAGQTALSTKQRPDRKRCQGLPEITMLEDSGQHASVIWAQR